MQLNMKWPRQEQTLKAAELYLTENLDNLILGEPSLENLQGLNLKINPQRQHNSKYDPHQPIALMFHPNAVLQYMPVSELRKQMKKGSRNKWFME